MAENILQTRIQLRYDTYTRWMNSNVILKPGETAIAYFPQQKRIEDLSNAEPENTPPAVGLKVGDGVRYFRELPWVQAISADVYNWAKSPYKPTYTAQEIEGLQSFIENIGGGSGGGGSSVARIYQLYEGSDDNADKYFLRYLDENGNWVIDTSTAVDLTSLANLISWINPVIINEYPSMTSRMNEQIQVLLGRLDVTDVARDNQFVTAVAEEDGKVQVSRARPTFSNIAGTATVAQGGTGRTSFPENTVLVGNENEGLLYRRIAEEIDTSNNLVPSGLIKAYVDSATAGLEGAMHFIGEATVAPIGGINPQIAEYNFANAQPGDVVLWEQKEYVWTGGNWRLLGDEGSYAVKGSIRDADIDTDANIQQSKIANLTDTLATKVDKEQGKGLSTNDYTTEDKLKLAGIQEGAQQNVIEHIYLNDVEQQPHTVSGVDKVVELNVKEYDDESRRKLGTIQEGAQVNSIESISVNGCVQNINPTNKNVDLAVKEFTDEYKTKVDTLEPVTIKEIALNGRTVPPDLNKKVNLEIVTLTQQQVDKLDGIEEGAQVNTITSIIYDRTPLTPRDGVITIESNPHTEHINVIEHIYLNGSEVQPDNNKTVSLSVTGTLSQAQIDKLNGIEEHAEVNEIKGIQVNGVTQEPNNNKIVNLILNKSTLGITAIEGAEIPDGNEKQEVNVIQNKLQLARIAVTSNVEDLIQTANTYILLDCGTSIDVI